ncbi:MAG: MlaE family lipid ABC transporter permease subunit [Alphaproteobacteria bacterium]|jgi:phospholipid/cholesterol/gamma-HCH transport system permease protein|nr:MlaE family lipid ABC transporter permease subunit [Alphaproteobacteria bacterium]
MVATRIVLGAFGATAHPGRFPKGHVLTLTADPDIPASAEHATLDGTGDAWRVSGALTVRSVSPIASRLAGLTGELDLSGLTRLDTAGAYLLQSHAASLRLTGARPDHAALLERVGSALPQPPEPETRRWSVAQLLDRVGRVVNGAGGFLVEITAMLGLFLARLGQVLRHPGQLPMTALVHHADQVGWRAIPIVSLMSFLIGVVLAFQGAVQLRQFGAEIFVVDLIAISILRELGILLTAIIVAGRTASSFTAAIGSMKMREEVDAMRTLAIDPAMVLFVPRILALLITLPILGAVANFMGLFGGALMAWVELGVSPPVFLARLLAETGTNHVLVGFVKAPVFALIIGVIGCHAGMQVGGNAESLGAQTSAAVVRAIFAVIVADAMFSIFFAMMDI